MHVQQSSCFALCPIKVLHASYLMQVDSQWTNKDYEGARKASLYAKRWSIAALVVGGVGFVIISVVVITYEVAGVIAYS